MSEKHSNTIVNIQINWSQVVTTFIVTAVITAVTTTVALLRFADSQTIIVAGHTKAIEELKTSYLPSSIFVQHSNYQVEQFNTVNTAISDLKINDQKIIDLLNQLLLR